VSLFGALFFIAGFAWVGGELYRSSYVTREGTPVEQPLPFSHKHHVRDDGIDCRYCHTTVENSSFAGIPSTKICLTCHNQIWPDAPMLQPVRNGQPIQWARVNYLPQFVYFDHSIHVHKGVDCTTCHGPVGDMPLTWQGASLQMRWCLDCHQHPEPYHAKSLTDCYTCHR